LCNAGGGLVAAHKFYRPAPLKRAIRSAAGGKILDSSGA
jgi:hypothetical protein